RRRGVAGDQPGRRGARGPARPEHLTGGGPADPLRRHRGRGPGLRAMDDTVRDRLRDVGAQHGVTIAGQPQPLGALLLDLCPDRRPEVFVLVTAAEEGVGYELTRPHLSVPIDVLIGNLVRRLTAMGLDQAAARWSVESWALALPGVSSFTAAAAP